MVTTTESLAGRICFFVPRMKGGGAERDAILLANGLARLDLPVAILTLERTGPLAGLIDLAVPLVEIGGGRGRLASAWLPFSRLLRQGRAAALIASQPAAIATAFAARRLLPPSLRPAFIVREVGVPSVARRADPYWQNRLAYALAPFVYRRADLVVTLTEGVRGELVDRMGIPAAKVVNLGTNAVITDGFGARTTSTREANLTLAVGRLSFEKGQDTLLRAFAILRREVDAKLIIAGDGPARADLQALAESLGIAPHVTFAGFVLDPTPLLQRAAVFVSPSRFEGLGNAIIEALATGTPVVSTDAPHGPREILLGGKLGALVPVNDPAALARAIGASLQLAHDPAPLKARGMDYTVERAANAFRQCLMRAGVREAATQVAFE